MTSKLRVCDFIFKSRFPAFGFYLDGCGLSGEPGCLITIDCSDLASDVARRLSEGESPAELMPELHYGVMAEVEVFVRELLNRIQTTMENNMINTDQNGLSNNPQPTTLMLLDFYAVLKSGAL